MKEIVFYTHANNRTGFGHLARCINISKILLSLDKTLKIYFMGRFKKTLKDWISSQLMVSFAEPKKKYLVIYDRMDDIKNPENININLIKKMQKKSAHLVFLANGKKLIKRGIFANITVIGYKIGKELSKKPNIFWDLKYAPVNVEKINIKSKNSVLIALGGNNGNDNMDKVLKALSKCLTIKNIFLLTSPVNKSTFNSTLIRKNQNIKCFYRVPDINFLLKKVNLVIASYGHLGYEALAAGIPVCFLNQKRFQTIYSKTLVQKNLCFSAGNLKNVTIKKISEGITETISNSDIYIKNLETKFRNSGLRNVAKIIYDLAKN